MAHSYKPLQVAVIALSLIASPAIGQESGNQSDQNSPPTVPPSDDRPEKPNLEPLVTGSNAMTNERLNDLIGKIGDAVTYNDNNIWEFSIAEIPVRVITDEKVDRMRVLVPVQNTSKLTPELLQRLMQANFDSALDARYAVAQGVVWSTFIHPLSALTDRQFISGVGQTVNLSKTFGTTFSSGALIFGGGDSGDLIARELIEELLKKGGQEI